MLNVIMFKIRCILIHYYELYLMLSTFIVSIKIFKVKTVLRFSPLDERYTIAEENKNIWSSHIFNYLISVKPHGQLVFHPFG